MHARTAQPPLAAAPHQLGAGELTWHYEAGLGKTIVEVGNDAAAGADMRIVLNGNVHLDAHDFVM